MTQFKKLDILEGNEFVKAARKQYNDENIQKLDQYVLNRLKTDFKIETDTELEFIDKMLEAGFTPLNIYRFYLYLSDLAENRNVIVSDYFTDSSLAEEMVPDALLYFCRRFSSEKLTEVISVFNLILNSEIEVPEDLLKCIFTKYKPEAILDILKQLDDQGYIMTPVFDRFSEMHKLGILNGFLKSYAKQGINYRALAKWVSDNKNRKIGNLILKSVIENGDTLFFLSLLQQ